MALCKVKQCPPCFAQQKPATSHSLLDTVRRAIVSGKLAYYSFLGATVLALWWLYDHPGLLERVAGTNDPRWLVVVAFAIAGLIILLWSWTVDGKLAAKYSSFWNKRRGRLCELLR